MLLILIPAMTAIVVTQVTGDTSTSSAEPVAQAIDITDSLIPLVEASSVSSSSASPSAEPSPSPSITPLPSPSLAPTLPPSSSATTSAAPVSTASASPIPSPSPSPLPPGENTAKPNQENSNIPETPQQQIPDITSDSKNDSETKDLLENILNPPLQYLFSKNPIPYYYPNNRLSSQGTQIMSSISFFLMSVGTFLFKRDV